MIDAMSSSSIETSGRGVVLFKLISGTNLSNSSGCWKLPENLEPNAVMPYFWGMKGAVETGAELPLFLYLHGSGPKERE